VSWRRWLGDGGSDHRRLPRLIVLVLFRRHIVRGVAHTGLAAQ
jgi:hypothetical protein